MKTILPFCLVLIAPLPAATAATATLAYRYDAAGRLTGLKQVSGGILESGSQNNVNATTYRYDKNGSLTTRITGVGLHPENATNYSGLFTHFSGPGFASFGAISVKIASTGSFSGTITVEGTAYRFAGSFAPDGTAPPIIITRKSPLLDLTLLLALDTSRADGTSQITGILTQGLNTAEIALDRASFNSKTFPAPMGLAGKYTAAIQPVSPASTDPTGDGFVTISLTTTGKLRAVGKLPNNTSFTQSSALVGPGNSWPLFVSLDAKKGSLTGFIEFFAQPESDVAGSVYWFKPASTKLLHPNQIANTLELIGSKYLPPLRGQTAMRVWAKVPNVTFEASGGNLPASISAGGTLDSANRFLPSPNSISLKLSLLSSTGLFNTSFKDGATARKGIGVIIQKANLGTGFFPGLTEGGLVQFRPDP
ncbi:MAG: RHS repeat protein [Verrucomicrobiaceae bacterium]|nr:RHS repeat protein [Verrucomicrobiaceae bacterium]